LTFFNVLGDYFISQKKWTCRPTPKRGHMLALLYNATYMRLVQIGVRQTQNLPVTSRDVS